MVSEKQRKASQANIKKAQAAWKNMSSTQRARVQPQGRKRARIGTKGGGNYFRIEVRPKYEFIIFRYHDVGDPGHIERLAGKRPSGSWDTHAWLISKEDAHVEGSTLVPDTKDAQKILHMLGSKPVRMKADIFKTYE